VKILITGGTGFVGSAVIRDAVAHRHDVVSLSRGVLSRGHPYPVTNVKLDLVRPQGLREALHGVKAVVHAAGIVSESGGQSFERLHVGGTANLVDACVAAKVEKIVLVSALGARANSPSAYLKTKWEAEQIVEHSGVPYTVFRPALIFGAGDRFITRLLTLLRYLPVMPVLGTDGAQIRPVWVGDVATAIARSLADPTTNAHAYDLCGPVSMTFDDLVELLKTRTGHSALSIRLPAFLAQPLVHLGERMLSKPPLTLDQLTALLAGNPCDPNPAAVTFGLRMRSLVDVLPEYEAASR
jgi:uncharacterized protein YbjT (DUF2867 family)